MNDFRKKESNSNADDKSEKIVKPESNNDSIELFHSVDTHSSEKGMASLSEKDISKAHFDDGSYSAGAKQEEQSNSFYSSITSDASAQKGQVKSRITPVSELKVVYEDDKVVTESILKNSPLEEVYQVEAPKLPVEEKKEGFRLYEPANSENIQPKHIPAIDVKQNTFSGTINQISTQTEHFNDKKEENASSKTNTVNRFSNEFEVATDYSPLNEFKMKRNVDESELNLLVEADNDINSGFNFDGQSEYELELGIMSEVKTDPVIEPTINLKIYSDEFEHYPNISVDSEDNEAQSVEKIYLKPLELEAEMLTTNIKNYAENEPMKIGNVDVVNIDVANADVLSGIEINKTGQSETELSIEQEQLVEDKLLQQQAALEPNTSYSFDNESEYSSLHDYQSSDAATYALSDIQPQENSIQENSSSTECFEESVLLNNDQATDINRLDQHADNEKENILLSEPNKASRSEKPTIKRGWSMVPRSPKSIAIYIIAIIVLIVIIALIFNDNSSTSNMPKNEEIPFAQRSTESSSNTSETRVSLLEENVRQIQGSDISGVPTEAELTTPRNQQRVEIPGDVVDALSTALETNSISSDGSLVGDSSVGGTLNNDSSSSGTLANIPNATIAATSSTVTPKETLKVEPKPAVNKVAGLGDGESTIAALNKISGTNVTIQLSGASKAESLRKFAVKHKLNNYWIYETRRNNQPWFVLIMGSYASTAEANKAVAELPAEVRANKPWIKPVRQVRNEIK